MHNEYDEIAKHLIDKRGSSHFLFTNNKGRLLPISLTQLNIHLQRFNSLIKNFRSKEMKKLQG
jgi:hypothetical protein